MDDVWTAVLGFRASADENEAGGLAARRAEQAKRWLWSEVEVYNGEENQFRVQLMGGGQVVGFMFDGEGPATAMRYSSRVFNRVRR